MWPLAAGVRSGRAASGDISSYHDAEKENFLKLAKILAVEQIGHGVTKPLKVKLAEWSPTFGPDSDS